MWFVLSSTLISTCVYALQVHAGVVSALCLRPRHIWSLSIWPRLLLLFFSSIMLTFPGELSKWCSRDVFQELVQHVPWVPQLSGQLFHTVPNQCTSSLDPQSRTAMVAVVKQLQRGPVAWAVGHVHIALCLSVSERTVPKHTSNRAGAKEVFRGSGNYIGPCLPIVFYALLTFTDRVLERKCRMPQELSDKVCKTSDAPASLKSGTGKHFDFPVPGNEKGEKESDRRKSICRRCWNPPNTPLRRLSAHIVTFQVQWFCLCRQQCFRAFAQLFRVRMCDWVCLKHALHLSAPLLCRWRWTSSGKWSSRAPPTWGWTPPASAPTPPSTPYVRTSAVSYTCTLPPRLLWVDTCCSESSKIMFIEFEEKIFFKKMQKMHTF